MLGGFGVFAQRALHGGVAQNEHLIGHRALELGHRAHAADHAVAAGAHQHAGHARFGRALHRPVKGIHAVQHFQLGGQCVGIIAAVVADGAHALFADEQVAVRVDQAGGDVAAGGIQHLFPLFRGQGRGHFGDLAAAHANVFHCKAAFNKIQYQSAFDKHRKNAPFFVMMHK